VGEQAERSTGDTPYWRSPILTPGRRLIVDIFTEVVLS